MEISSARKRWVISLAVLCLRRRCTHLNSLVVTSFRIMWDHSLINLNIFVVFLALFDYSIVFSWSRTLHQITLDRKSLIPDSNEENHIERDEPTFPWPRPLGIWCHVISGSYYWFIYLPKISLCDNFPGSWLVITREHKWFIRKTFYNLKY